MPAWKQSPFCRPQPFDLFGNEKNTFQIIHPNMPKRSQITLTRLRKRGETTQSSNIEHTSNPFYFPLNNRYTPQKIYKERWSKSTNRCTIDKRSSSHPFIIIYHKSPLVNQHLAASVCRRSHTLAVQERLLLTAGTG